MVEVVVGSGAVVMVVRGAGEGPGHFQVACQIFICNSKFYHMAKKTTTTTKVSDGLSCV